MAIQKGFTVDVNQCVGCRACETACKVEYDLQISQGRRRRVIEREEKDSLTKVRSFFTSLACNHCVEPACLKACPVGAYIKYVHQAATTEPWHRNYTWLNSTHGPMTVGQAARIEGLVMLDPAKCIGCRRCEWACPYGAPQFNPDNKKIHKCEGCWQRVVDKQNKLHARRRVPACVDTCLGRSIHWDTVNTAVSPQPYNYQYTGPSADNPVGGGQSFYRPGESGTNKPGVAPADSGRGSSYVADWNLTKPALKIRNRVYQTRTGGWE